MVKTIQSCLDRWISAIPDEPLDSGVSHHRTMEEKFISNKNSFTGQNVYTMSCNGPTNFIYNVKEIYSSGLKPTVVSNI